MNWYKKAQLRGEWWIIDGQAIFADADIGDMNHEAYVIQSIQSKYAYNEFDKGEWIDWDGFKMKLAEEAFQEQNEQHGKINFETYKKNFPDKVEDMYLAKLKEMGMTNEEYQIAEGMGDAREYGMKHLGWKRVKEHSVQTETLTSSDLKEIANGLWDAYDEECEKETFAIEVNAIRQVYYDVPYYLISNGSPSQLQAYRSRG